MRKIFFVSLICLTGLIARPVFIQAETLPKEIQEMVLKDMGFFNPIKKAFVESKLERVTHCLDNNPYHIRSPQKGTILFFSGKCLEEWYLWRDKFFLRNGYMRVIEDMSNVSGVLAEDKLKPYLEKGFDASLVVKLAKRVLKTINYVNKWKLEGLDAWSFTFTYFFEPVFSELPRLGPFTGKGTATLNPATGRWETYFGPRFGSSLGDGGAIEYTAWLKKQPVPSTLPVKPSQPPGQIPSTVETPEKMVAEALDELRTAPILSREEIHRFGETEKQRITSLGSYRLSELDPIMAQARQAHKKGGYQRAVDIYEKLLSLDPENFAALLHLSDCYLSLKNPDKALQCAIKAFKRIPQPVLFLNISSAFAQKDNKKEAFFWLEKAFASNFFDLQYIKDYLKTSDFSKYKSDLDYLLLVQRYLGLGYSVTVDGKQYRVGGDIFTGGKERVLVFVDEKGATVRDPTLAKKIAEAAWIYENVVKVPGEPRSKKVSAILETHKALRRYEVTQDILARASVQILAATVSAGATLTYVVPAGLTWRVVRDQFVNLKGLLSLTGRTGLEEALNKYREMESIIARLKSDSIDEATAKQIRKLYESAYELDLPYSALLTSLMPKRGGQLVDKALKSIGDELVRTLPLSDEVLTTNEILGLQRKMDDALKSNPALKEYYEKLEMAKRLKEANEQVISAWAEQTVGYKETKNE